MAIVSRSAVRTAPLIAVLALACLLSTTGCQGFVPGGSMVDNIFVRHRDRVWAARAYNEQCGGRMIPFGDHHRRGFVEGYCSVCRGGDGYVPAVPPRDYWTSQYQSAQGAQCVNAWFEGFPAGAEAARSDNAGRFNDLYVSRMLEAAVVQEKQGVRLPSETEIVSRDDLAESPVESEPGFGEGNNGPIPLPSRDWTNVFPDLKSASGQSGGSGAANEGVR